MRIRTIKPEFWRSDDIDALPIEDRLLFIGLWSYVDDYGVGIDKESAIAADLFAGDLSRNSHECSVRVHEGLKRLSSAGLITRYTVNGRNYLHVTNWNRHQRVNRPTPSRFPQPTHDDAQHRSKFSEDSEQIREASLSGTEEQGNRGTGEVPPYSPPTAEAKPRTRKPSSNEPKRFADFYDAYPRHKGRSAAAKAFAQALQRGAQPDQLIDGARRYRDEMTGKDPQFIKHPATWLNQGCWWDEPDPPSTVGQRGGLSTGDQRVAELQRWKQNLAEHEQDPQARRGLPKGQLA